MADARQISVRLAIEGAEQARAQLEAVREAAKKTGEEGAPTAAQLRQWDSLQRSVDGNHAAAARYADTVRRVQAAEAAGLGTAEQRNRVLEQAAVAHQRATTSMEAHANGARGYGAALGQAGFQVQDFATQVAMGQNAVTAFGVQFAQFAGMFGTAGAIAGAAVTVGILGAQFLDLAGNAETLDEAIKQVEDSYKRMNDVAERRIKGVEEEAAAINRLAVGYGTLGAAGQRAEGLQLRRQDDSLRLQADQLRAGLANSLPSSVQRGITPRDATNALGEDLGLAVPDARFAAMAQALAEIGQASGRSAEGIRNFAAAAQEASEAGGRNAMALLRSRDAALDMLPAAARLDEAVRSNAAQTVALMEAQGAGRAEIDRYTARFGALGVEVARAAAELRRLQEFTVANPLAALETDLANIEARRAALASRGLEGLRAEEQAQRDATQAAADANRVYEEQVRILRQGETPEQREQRARAAQAAALQEAFARNQAAEALREETRQAEENARIQERQAQRVQSAVQRAEEERRRAGEQEAARQARAFDQAEELARRTAQQAVTAGRREQDRAEADARRIAEREAEQNARRLDRTVERFGDNLADVTFNALEAGATRGQNVFQSLASGFGSILRRAAVDALSLSVAQPLVRGVADSIGFTGATSGAGSALGSVGNLLGFTGGGGIAEGINGYAADLFPSFFTSTGAANLATPASLAATTPEALMAALPAGPTSAMGTSFLGSLGGAAGGFAIGSTVGGVLAGRSQARQTNAQIGAGIGTAAGFFLPGGPLVWGPIGGAVGGLIGPGPKTNAYGFSLEALDGQFGVAGLRMTGDGNGGREAFAAAQQQAAQLNAILAAAGLTVADTNRVINGQTNSADQSATLNDALKVFRFSATNGGTLGQIVGDRGFAGAAALQEAISFATTYDQLAGVADATDQWAQQIKALNATYDAATTKAREFGLATDGLATQLAKNVQIVEAQRQGTILGGLVGQSRVLTDFLASRSLAAGSPQSQIATAREQYEAALNAARVATAESADLQRYTAAANTFLNASSAFYGTGAQAAAIESMVRSQTIALGQSLDLPAFTDDVTGAIERAADRQVDQLQILNSRVDSLIEENRTMRLLVQRILSS